MSRMSPPASAMACAIFATIPRAFLPVVVTTARLPPPSFVTPSFPPLPFTGEGGVSAAATSAATMAARSARRPAFAATARVTLATRPRTSASSSASFTGQLHALDDGRDGGVAAQVAVVGPWLEHVARARAERHRHVLAAAGVEHVGGHHQPPRRAPRRVVRRHQQQLLAVQARHVPRPPELPDH